MNIISIPPTGDAGINPIVIVLFLVCAVIVISCMFWAFFLNRKKSNVKTTVITITDEEATENEPTIIEEINNFEDQ